VGHGTRLGEIRIVVRQHDCSMLRDRRDGNGQLKLNKPRRAKSSQSSIGRGRWPGMFSLFKRDTPVFRRDDGSSRRRLTFRASDPKYGRAWLMQSSQLVNKVAFAEKRRGVAHSCL